MKSIWDEKDLFEALIRLIAGQFGSNCEVVVHDLTGKYDHTIAFIENGHVTNRKVGDCGSNLGLEVLRGTVDKGDRFGYITHTPDGKILKSSTIYMKDSKGGVIGSICINLDVSNIIMANRMLKEFFNPDAGGDAPADPKSKEIFAANVGQLLDALIRDALAMVDKPASMMTREDKIRAIAYLDARGAFLVSKAGSRICKQLKISKYTLYSYLEKSHDSPPAGPETGGGRERKRRGK
ncbi:MAG: helix-turn-helix transcriptional regulator [Planctomycetota bacterium]|nr:helix-turn-helix transcriptional regulator [Planctomycetota bacterium]